MQRIGVFIFYLSAVVVLSSCAACGTVKGLQYVQGNLDSAALAKIQFSEPVVQRGDLISISVFSDDPLATAAVTNQMPQNSDLNSSSIDAMTTSRASNSPTYLVDQQGDIRLYRLGTVHAEGMLKKQLADTLAILYERAGLLKNPFVEVRFINYRVSLIGEVAKPGVYSIPGERISVFEAVGLAGDITAYGRRDNVLVVREVNGTREFARLDLSKSDVFLSPYFYLQQNDMVIVDVRKNKSAVNDQVTVRNIAIATSVLSTVAIFINIFNN